MKKHLNSIFSVSMVAICAISLTSCASMMNGRYQNVPITTCPEGANVIIDNKCVGQSPMNARLLRKKDHMVVLELDGYQPFELYLEKEVSKWVLGNFVVGGFIGIGVDIVSGGVYKFNPKKLDVQMHQDEIVYSQKTPDGCFAILTNPDENWELIGQLEK